MRTNLLNNFYSEFIELDSELQFTLEILIEKFKHKLMPRFQDKLNSTVNFATSILALAK